ncbi:MAG: hypothetical protein HKO55_09220 [Gammaproteobacteria bacterium]|nr:hypothetical protein [Gammaproteobacteria bacterium]
MRFGLACMLFLCVGIAHADLYASHQADGVISYSDRANSDAARSDVEITHPLEAAQLPGTWHTDALNGERAELQLGNDGSFVFNQFGDSTRTYMCGAWNGDVETLNLTVKALKRQTEDGAIEQAAGTYQETAPILSSQRDRMIVVIDGQKLVFNRAG